MRTLSKQTHGARFHRHEENQRKHEEASRAHPKHVVHRERAFTGIQSLAQVRESLEPTARGIGEGHEKLGIFRRRL